MHGIVPLAVRTALLRVPFQGRASVRADALLRRVVHVVALIGRIAGLVLEGMQQAEPVPDFVHRRFALLVPFEAVVRHRGREHVAPVVDVGARRLRELLALAVRGAILGRAGGGRVGDGVGQGAVPQQGRGDGAGGCGRREVGLEVDV